MNAFRALPSIVLSALPLVAVAAEPGGPVSEGQAREILDSVDQDLARMKEDYDVVARGYGQPIATTPAGKLERRLREGEIHFLLGDYMRASITLLDVVEDESAKSHPKYDDVVFFFAESLRRTGNYGGAREHLEQIMPRATGDRLKDIVLGLLEIASATDHYENVEKYIARLRDAGGLSRPDVDYIHGKMLFKSAGGDKAILERAYTIFKGVPEGNRVSAQSAYYAGVVLVSLQRYDDAVAQFKEALRRASATPGPEGVAIKDLAALSLGRLFIELGDISKAVDAYQEIAVSSPHLSDMLYEVAWAYVRQASQAKTPEERTAGYTRALRTVEILMASAPDSKLYPEARILEGNLQIRLGGQEEGYDAFQSIIDRYGGAQNKLAQLIAENPDPKQFFEQVIAQDMTTGATATSFMPPVAIAWAIDTPEMKRTVGILHDIRKADADSREAKELLQTLSEALRSEQRYTMFSGLGEARVKAFGIENRLVILNRRLMTLERRMLYPNVSDGERASLDAAYAKREALEAEVQSLPQTAEQVGASQESIKAKYQDVERRAFRQTYQIASMRAQAVAVEVWLNENRGSLSPKEVELMEQRIKTAKDMIVAIETASDQLMADIRTARAVSSGDAGRFRAQHVREQYTQVMTSEVELLRGMRAKLPPGFAPLSARVDQQREAVKRMNEDLQRLQSVLDQQVDVRVAELREQLEAERVRLEKYDGEQVAVRQSSDGMLGPVATQTMKRVAAEFKELVRKADVGIIDVAWARKQAETNRVAEAIKEQQERSRELENEFADVLGNE